MIWMEPPKMGSYDGQAMLESRIMATGGRRELRAFAKKAGFDKPVFSRAGKYDEHIRVSGRGILERVKAAGAEQTGSAKAFQRMLAQRREGAKGEKTA